jgi:hypothetical protein
VTALLVPPLSLVYVVGACMLLRRARPRLGRIIAWAGLLGLIVLATPAVGYTLLGLLGRDLPVTPLPDDPPQAIVILSADISRAGVQRRDPARRRHSLHLPGHQCLAHAPRAAGVRPDLAGGYRGADRSRPRTAVL